MKDIDLSTKKKLIIFASLGLAFWGAVAWLFISVPIFIIDLLPPFLPFLIFTFFLFLIGLILLTIAAMPVVRSISPRYAWTVILLSASIIVLYNLSPLAPSWNCWGKRLYVLTVKAGQTCTTICTNNKKKPCGGWSDCWGGKDISCSSAGKDQDGRNCNGCCFSCDVECEDDDPPPPSYNPPTISASVSCAQPGSNGWCVGGNTLNLTASDPQGLSLTISGTIAGVPFTCPAGNSCSIPLSEGSGAITFEATAATSGLSSATGSTSWAQDASLPTVTPIIPTPTGSNGWYITSPIAASTTGADAVSGVASMQLQINGGAWQTTAAFLPNGIYAVNFRTVDVAGNTSAVESRTIKVDSVAPTLTPNFPAANGLNGWVVQGCIRFVERLGRWFHWQAPCLAHGLMDVHCYAV
jgi:hypothetical protein